MTHPLRSLALVLSLPVSAWATSPLIDPNGFEALSPLAQAAPASGPSLAASPAVAGKGASTASAPSSTGTTPTVAKSGDVDPEDEPGAHVSVSLAQAVGLGTFVAPETQSYLGGTLGLGASYGFKVKDTLMAASASWSVSYEYTLPDDESGRRASPSDVRLGLAAPALFKSEATGIAISPNFGLVLPVTPDSWHATLITSLSLGVGASRKFGDFMVKVGVGGGRAFYASPFNPTYASNRKDQYGHTIVVGRDGEIIVNSAGMNPAWSLSGNVGVSWAPTKQLGVSVGLGYRTGWKNAATDQLDEFTAKALDSNGNQIAHAGMGRSDSVGGNLGLSYALNDHFGLELSLGTGQPPLIKDPKTGQYVPRFPFLAVGQLAGNASSLSFGVSGNF